MQYIKRNIFIAIYFLLIKFLIIDVKYVIGIKDKTYSKSHNIDKAIHSSIKSSNFVGACNSKNLKTKKKSKKKDNTDSTYKYDDKILTSNPYDLGKNGRPLNKPLNISDHAKYIALSEKEDDKAIFNKYMNENNLRFLKLKKSIPKSPLKSFSFILCAISTLYLLKVILSYPIFVPVIEKLKYTNLRNNNASNNENDIKYLNHYKINGYDFYKFSGPYKKLPLIGFGFYNGVPYFYRKLLG